MRFIIVGAGDVGISLAERLTENQHDVILIEKDNLQIERVPISLDLQIVEGNGCHPPSLIEAGLMTADYILAVADIDEVNIAACLSAKLINPSVKRIARIRNINLAHREIPKEYLDEYFDLIINPDQAGAEYLMQLFKLPGAKEVIQLADDKLRAVGLEIKEKSPFKEKKVYELKSLNLNFPVILIAILRGEKLIIPRGNDSILVGDIVYSLTSHNNLRDLYELAGEVLPTPKNAMIWGGSALGRSVAHSIEDEGTQVKLIVSNPDEALDYVDEFKSALILKGMGTDQGLLEQENIKGTDVFIAASQHEEDNILAALLAKKLGATRSMALVNKASYLPLVTAIGVDAVVSTHIAAAQDIFRHIHKDALLAEFRLKQKDATFIEISVTEEMSFVDTPIVDLHFPQGTIVASVVRGEEIIIPHGDDKLLAGDKVVVFAAKQALRKLQKLLGIKLELLE